MLYFTIAVLISFGTTFGAPPSGRIFGGKIASPGQFPFIAHLNGECGGTIINKNWVLTAAHCLNYVLDGAKVHVGTNNLGSGGTKYNISQYIQHEGYEPYHEGSRDDIGLVQIDGEFEFTELVQPAEFIDPEENSTCMAVGWGTTETEYVPDELHFVELTSLDYELCRDIAGDLLGNLYLGPEQVCAWGPAGKGVCFGDSGGPLVCDGRLAGVVSYGILTCAQGYPDVYTKSTVYVDWINEKIQA